MGKKSLGMIVGLFTAVSLAVAGCSTSASSSNSTGQATEPKKEVTLKVGAAPVPHAEILEFIKPKLKEQGVNLEVVVLDDEGQLNPALKEKQIDANFFQHVPYLDSVKNEQAYDFVVTTKVHVEPIGFYSDKLGSKDEIKEGAKIGIPNNPSNEYRALILLQEQGWIKLKGGLTNYAATPKDIADNPKKLEFVEVEAATLPRVLPDLAGAVINTNIVLEAKLDPKSALFREGANSPYANVITVGKGDENREEIKKLDAALTSAEVKKFIEDKYGVAVVPAF
ncbi:MetQ/NlpA family ABC transporter substrate-binding protein [Brevibacillus porteri]|uniref:Lipoprotein n=1 Tax=Brevibacillus porteri TaxID=2126350 RepID=A0ABX5FSM2_9BACL|nr:MetQ/NlpA family ABC transporter substrate-binding protein [Brevibacillus porteri]MED1799270.1 MetQ/NlpA family ABC transporter substrate-binding protein [Brevibacillus porteri]MED2132342.1 MetQ/NlpA family ABC transporter substrate-binding protein [Brevibacillus porteri]MED2744426.1 MetQ/NlpA family ABC transporter substrate-binding protein [Brevibacillus porteri]MED2814870.1 MetQ/NlpA family ABC transporter substrate-binding protein [Brevibacillus porteri]MED2895685.1 MetQ/NlpA family ABC